MDTFVSKHRHPVWPPHSCPHHKGQMIDGYFTHVQPLLRTYSLVYVGHGSSWRRSRSVSWPSAWREIISRSTHHNARQGNLWLSQDNTSQWQRLPRSARGDPSPWHSLAELSGIDSHQRAKPMRAQPPVQLRISGDQGSSWIIYLVQDGDL